jgi:transglutaminase-like putative cysteine protease
MTDALAALGLLALISSGQLNRWISLALVIGAAAAILLPERYQDRPLLRQLGVYAPVTVLAIQVARLVLGAGLLELAVEFAAALQVVRLASRRGAAHDQQVIVLALLHLIAGTVLGGNLAYGLCFLGFLIVTPGALVLSHLRREVEGNYRQGARDRTGLPVDVPRILRSRRVIGRPFLLFTCLLSIPIFLFTAGLFVVFPRVGLSLLLLNHARPERMIGFSDRVDLGGVGKLRSDPTIAMRVEYPLAPERAPPRLALYLRGTAFDRYDGRSWSRSSTQRAPAERSGLVVPIRRFPKPELDRVLKVELEPINPPVLFLPSDAVAIKLAPPTAPGATTVISSGPEGQFSYSSLDDRGLRYDVYVAARPDTPARPLTDAERTKYLALPSGLPERVAELARTWVGAVRDPVEQARIVEAHLRTDYKYDLESPSGSAKNPLDHFLFESKRGHCEFYSTAMAVLLRSLGVPTRNVTGFIGGTYNRFGNYYAVRQGDAHSWVEVHFDQRGWTRFDPTPPAEAAPRTEIGGALAFIRDFVEATARRWNRHVVGYDLKQQLRLFHAMRDTYGELRAKRGPLAGLTASKPRLLLLLAGVGLLIGGIVWLRRQRGAPPAADRSPDDTRIACLHAVELYRSLESALAARGVPRPASTPPLSHANALSALGHPASQEILALTQLYLEIRFGGRELGESDRRAFVRRVRQLRQLRDSDSQRSNPSPDTNQPPDRRAA